MPPNFQLLERAFLPPLAAVTRARPPSRTAPGLPRAPAAARLGHVLSRPPAPPPPLSPPPPGPVSLVHLVASVYPGLAATTLPSALPPSLDSFPCTTAPCTTLPHSHPRT
jgi:hypothetical protein